MRRGGRYKRRLGIFLENNGNHVELYDDGRLSYRNAVWHNLEDGEHVEHVSGVDTKLHHSQPAKAIDGSMRL